MSANLIPFTTDGGIISGGDITSAGYASPAPSISGFDSVSAVNFVASGNIDIDGEASVGGNLTIVGNITFSGGGSITEVTSAYGNFYGNSDGSNALYAGQPGGVVVPGAVASFIGDSNAYMQISAQNKNHGTQASMEWVVTGDLGTDTTDYLDLGFASSTWNGTQDNSLGTAVSPRDGWLYVQGGGGGGNLVLGTTTAGRNIKFNAGGPNAANNVANISNLGIDTLAIYTDNYYYANGAPLAIPSGNTSVTTTGNVTAGNISTSGNVTAGSLKGDGGNISNIQGANISGTVSTASKVANGNSNVNIATANGNVTISAVGNGVVTITGTGANITGTANISGNVAVANLSFSANAGQIAFNTAAYISGNANSLNRDGSILLSPYTGAGSNFAGVIIGGSGRLLSPGGSVHQIFNASDVTFQVAAKVITGTAATSTTTGALQITGGGGFTTNVYVGGSLVRTGPVVSTAWTTNGVGLKLPTAIYTDNSTSAGTQASSYVHLVDAPTLSFSNAVTVTNAATMYVAAPTAGTNATISNSFAILASGAVSATGNITTTGGTFVGNGAGLTNVTVNAAGNIQGTSSNVSLVAGSYTYTFDNTGVATMPGTVSATGNINGTAFAVGNGAVNNCAIAMTPTAGIPGNYAIRDYSTANSIMFFDTTIGSANTGGSFQFRSSNAFTVLANINTYGVVQPTKPGFRVYGAGTTNNLTTTVNTNGILTGNNYAVDYNQGGYLNTTTGIFTAPVAGLYSVHLVARVSNTSSAQIAIVKNYASTNTVQAMWEAGANCTANHFGVSSIAKLAVGDTLVIRVLLGQINFDSNDNWAIAFLG